MFGDSAFRSLFNTSFFEPSFGFQNAPLRSNHVRQLSNVVERCSLGPIRDVFTEVSRAVDDAFVAASRSILQELEMFPRQFYPNYLRDFSHIPSNRRTAGVTLSGETVHRSTDGTTVRSTRHTTNEPVQMERSRLQWYDSNTRRALAPLPAPTRGEPCGRLTTCELAKLPLSVYRIRPKEKDDSSDNSTNRSTFQPTVQSSPIPVAHGNNSSVICSPGSAYLQPVSKNQGVVEIQPLLSSPSRGQPECEVCLTEYREKDRLRHLPCGHAFHSKCIDAWFMQSSTCPKCRAGVRTGVRTGLKRLERNQQRMQAGNRNTCGAPVRAIRQRSTTVTRDSNGSTPQKNSNRRSNSQGTSSSPACELVETADWSESRFTELSLGTHAGSSGERLLQSEGTSQNDTTTSSGEHNANNEAIHHRRIIRRSPAQRLTTSPLSTRMLHIIPTIEDKSAIARRKAGEAAIRRAELAQQERARSVNGQSTQ